ncbi:dephospho-CoA kinase [Larkinella arboricola]|uniref:Dephospho-CoA kinase n=1 Tax=Larkinella arboricola TaxID=643671 RepID=A0A327WVU8_LARAB|nr:dephospho-CoA kinase [Larkinella arboricola]RAJ95565.1 dephospho-CoA kinase [Larkinella arboricola]
MSVAPEKPLLIGVTGGIGSGKSTVCRIFEAFGIPVYYADERAKWLVDHDAILKADVTRLLGPEAYDPIGRYNRTWVAAQVFGKPELLLQLNALIHPRVYADTAHWATEHAHKPYVVKEAALLRTAGEDGNNLDKLIVVQSPLELRIQRIKKRDPHRTEEEIQNIISRQISDEERIQMADYVVYNDETQLLVPQVVHLHKLFSESEL